MKILINLSSWSRSESDHVRHGGNYVDSEADEKRSNRGVDGAEERENDREEPYRDHNGESS